MYTNYPDYFGGTNLTATVVEGNGELNEEDLQPAVHQRRQSSTSSQQTANKPVVKPATSTEWLQQEEPPAFFSETTQDPFSTSNYHQPHYYTTDEEVIKEEEDADAFNWFESASKANEQPQVQSPVVEINYESYARNDFYNKQATTGDYFQNATSKPHTFTLPQSQEVSQTQELVFTFDATANETFPQPPKHSEQVIDYFSQTTGNNNYDYLEESTQQAQFSFEQSAYPQYDAPNNSYQQDISNEPYSFHQPEMSAYSQYNQTHDTQQPAQPSFTFDQPKEHTLNQKPFVESSHEEKDFSFDYQQPQPLVDSQEVFTFQQPSESQYGFSYTQQDESYPQYGHGEENESSQVLVNYDQQQPTHNYDQTQTTAEYPSSYDECQPIHYNEPNQYQYSYEQPTQDSQSAFNYFQPEAQQQYEQKDQTYDYYNNQAMKPDYNTEPPVAAIQPPLPVPPPTKSNQPPVTAPQSNTKICSRCAFENSSKVNFCGMCGQQLVEKLEVMNMLENLSISSNNSSSFALPTVAVGAVGITATTSIAKPPPSPIFASPVLAATLIKPEQQKVHPTVSFGFGGKAFYTFPKAQVRYNATSPTKGSTKYSPDSVHIMSQPPENITPPLLGMKPKELAKILDTFPENDIIKTMKLILEYGPRIMMESKVKQKLAQEVLHREDYLNFGASSGSYFNGQFREALAAGDVKKAFTCALDDSDWLGASVLGSMMKKEDLFELYKRFSEALPKGDPLKLFIVLVNNLPLTEEFMKELAQDWRQSVSLCMTLGLPMLDKVLLALSSHALPQDFLILQLLAGVEEPAFPTKEMSEIHEAIMHGHNPSYFKAELFVHKLEVAERLALDSNATEASRKYLQALNACLKTSTRPINPALLQRLKALDERLVVQEAANGKSGVSGGGWKPLQGLFDALDRGLQKMAGVEPEIISKEATHPVDYTHPTTYPNPTVSTALYTQTLEVTQPVQYAQPLDYNILHSDYTNSEYDSQPLEQYKSQPVGYGDYYHKPETSYDVTNTYYEQQQQAPYSNEQPYSYEAITEGESSGQVASGYYNDSGYNYGVQDQNAELQPYAEQHADSSQQPQDYTSSYNLTQQYNQEPQNYTSYYGPNQDQQYGYNSEQQKASYGYPAEPIQANDLPAIPTIKLSPVQPSIPMPSVPPMFQQQHVSDNSEHKPLVADHYDDLGFGNKPLKPATNSAESSSPVSSTKKSDATGSSSGVLGFFKKILPIGSGNSTEQPNTSPSLSNKSNSTRANLGQESSFYYDDKLKRWVNKGEEDKIGAGLPPPPPKMGEASPSSGSMGDVSMMTPPPPPVNVNNNNTKRPSTLRSKYVDPFSTNNNNSNIDTVGKGEEEKRTTTLVPPPPVAQYDQPTAF